MKRRKEVDISKRNRRYRELDANILALLLADRRYISISELKKKLKIDRSAFYIHYKDPNHALTDFKKKLVRNFTEYISKIETAKSRDEDRQLFRATIRFLSEREKEIIQPLCSNIDNYSILIGLMQALYPKLFVDWGTLEDGATEPEPEAIEAFLMMLVVILRRWGVQEECTIQQMLEYVNHMVLVTDNAKKIRSAFGYTK